MKKKQINWIQILRDAVENERIDYVATLRRCQEDFTKVPLSKVAADAGQEAWVTNFKAKTLGRNFAVLDNLCIQNSSRDFIVFDILSKKFSLQNKMFVKNSLMMTLNTPNRTPMTTFYTMNNKIDKSIQSNKLGEHISPYKLFNLFKSNKTDEIITIYKNRLLECIDILDNAVQNMTDKDVYFEPIDGYSGVLTPITTYYGSPQAVYNAFIDKLNSGYEDVQRNILEGIVVLGLCDGDDGLNILSKDNYYAKLDQTSRESYLSLNGILYWMKEKSNFDSIYR